uniref:Uncharacterized protein n=1 Tax=Panagrolaimus superbus TaxID=310955 RepID=A0A914YX52_9BILA
MLEPIVATSSSSSLPPSPPPPPLLFPSRHLSNFSGIERDLENRQSQSQQDERESIGGTSSILTIDPPSRKISAISSRKISSSSRVFSSVSKFMTLDFSSSSASRRLSQLLPPRSSATAANPSSSSPTNNNNNGGKRSMSSRLSAGQMSLRRFSGTKKDNIQLSGGSTMSTGRSLLAATLRIKLIYD